MHFLSECRKEASHGLDQDVKDGLAGMGHAFSIDDIQPAELEVYAPGGSAGGSGHHNKFKTYRDNTNNIK